jgi:hypothetical protein
VKRAAERASKVRRSNSVRSSISESTHSNDNKDASRAARPRYFCSKGVARAYQGRSKGAAIFFVVRPKTAFTRSRHYGIEMLSQSSEQRPSVVIEQRPSVAIEQRSFQISFGVNRQETVNNRTAASKQIHCGQNYPIGKVHYESQPSDTRKILGRKCRNQWKIERKISRDIRNFIGLVDARKIRGCGCRVQ